MFTWSEVTALQPWYDLVTRLMPTSASLSISATSHLSMLADCVNVGGLPIALIVRYTLLDLERDVNSASKFNGQQTLTVGAVNFASLVVIFSNHFCCLSTSYPHHFISETL